MAVYGTRKSTKEAQLQHSDSPDEIYSRLIYDDTCIFSAIWLYDNKGSPAPIWF